MVPTMVKEERLLGSSFAVIARILVLTIWIGTDAFDTVFNTWIFPLLALDLPPVHGGGIDDREVG